VFATEKPYNTPFEGSDSFNVAPENGDGQQKIGARIAGDICFLNVSSGNDDWSRFSGSWQLRSCACKKTGTCAAEGRVNGLYGFDQDGAMAVKVKVQKDGAFKDLWFVSPLVARPQETVLADIDTTTAGTKAVVDQMKLVVDETAASTKKTETTVNDIHKDLKAEADAEAVTACEARVFAFNDAVRDYNAQLQSAAYRQADTCTAETDGMYIPIGETIYQKIKNDDTGGEAPSSKDLNERAMLALLVNKVRKCDQKAIAKQFNEISTAICKVQPGFDPFAPAKTGK